ncbi:MAG: glycosyltransferase [Ardenticatenaceae bacterium]|nr:glycosyltransferase [Ardenticatenaceae bacterium]
MKSRLQLAYFSPLLPVHSGVADYSSELLPELAQHADITLFTENPQKIANHLTQEFSIRPIQDYPETRWQYDMPLYQIGNSSHHEAIYQMFLRYPGIVTLHDYSLHHFISHRTSGQGHFAGYVRELGYELGTSGIEQARQIRAGEQSHPLFKIPLNGRLLDLSLGLIVHSQYAKNLVSSKKSRLHVAVIPQLIAVHADKSRRSQLPWPDDAIIFASVGQITAEKQVDFALRAFQKVRQIIPNAYYLIVGEQTGKMDISNTINSLGLSEWVTLTGHIDNGQEFVDWIYSADIIINLRYPTIGETSRTALCALALERPLVVFDHGWYSELPDSACVKIAPLDEAGLAAAMLNLAQGVEKRQGLGRAGRQYIEQNCRPALAAKAYAAFIEQQIAYICRTASR